MALAGARDSALAQMDGSLAAGLILLPAPWGCWQRRLLTELMRALAQQQWPQRLIAAWM